MNHAMKMKVKNLFVPVFSVPICCGFSGPAIDALLVRRECGFKKLGATFIVNGIRQSAGMERNMLATGMHLQCSLLQVSMVCLNRVGSIVRLRACPGLAHDGRQDARIIA